MGFQLFGRNACVSHAYVRLAGFGKPIKVAGVDVSPGDLIHADKHGVCIIPLEIAPKLAEACREVERLERPLLDLCRSDQFDLEEYIRRRAEMKTKIRE
jgi:regulator of RNase E activity RraA